ncbi:MAG: DUF6175 family protein [Paludibacteraceae bacterium]|jgi:hypothetical protein|nr:DUF6175 family protein [Paludibacteraceae bacterium]
MKKEIILMLMMLSSIFSYAQTSKKPTIMVIPSDHWCTTRYFTKVIDNQGVKVTINDYEGAFREDLELSNVVSKIGEIMVKFGYPVKDYMQEYKSLIDEQVEEEVVMSRGGAMIEETPLDMLRSRVRYDIELRIDWNVKKENNKYAVTMNIGGIDTYSNKQIASANEVLTTGDLALSELIVTMLEDKMVDFLEQLNSHFDEVQSSGREVKIQIRTWDTGEITLEDEVESGEELIDVINNWMEDNTINGAFNLAYNTESRAVFEQVRIPTINKNGRSMDARMFANELRKYLKKEFSIDSKVLNRGLGEGVIIIGEK